MTEYLAILLVLATTLATIHSAPQSNTRFHNYLTVGQDLEAGTKSNHFVKSRTDPDPTPAPIQVQNDLQFPPGFVPEDATNPGSREDMYVLVWTMCDNYRNVADRLRKILLSSRAASGRHSLEFEKQIQFLRFQLENNPMEPSYHRTCLELFRRYPNMRERIDGKGVPLLSDK